MDYIFEKIGEAGVVPVVEIEEVAAAARLGHALIAGGLPVIEVTLRSEASEKALTAMARALPEMLVGAGAVINVEQAERAQNSGALFIISPGFNPRVVTWCLQHKMPIIPGVLTPSEIIEALEMDLNLLQIYPAEVLGGPAGVKTLIAPFVGVNFIPTGGVNPSNLADYLNIPSVFACGGSWLSSKKLISSENFEEITRLALQSKEIVRESRTQSGVPE